MVPLLESSLVEQDVPSKYLRFAICVATYSGFALTAVSADERSARGWAQIEIVTAVAIKAITQYEDSIAAIDQSNNVKSRTNSKSSLEAVLRAAKDITDLRARFKRNCGEYVDFTSTQPDAISIQRKWDRLLASDGEFNRALGSVESWPSQTDLKFDNNGYLTLRQLQITKSLIDQSLRSPQPLTEATDLEQLKKYCNSDAQLLEALESLRGAASRKLRG